MRNGACLALFLGAYFSVCRTGLLLIRPRAGCATTRAHGVYQRPRSLELYSRMSLVGVPAEGRRAMDSIIYLVGLVVVIMLVLSMLGLR